MAAQKLQEWLSSIESAQPDKSNALTKKEVARQSCLELNRDQAVLFIPENYLSAAVPMFCIGQRSRFILLRVNEVPGASKETSYTHYVALVNLSGQPGICNLAGITGCSLVMFGRERAWSAK